MSVVVKIGKYYELNNGHYVRIAGIKNTSEWGVCFLGYVILREEQGAEAGLVHYERNGTACFKPPSDSYSILREVRMEPISELRKVLPINGADGMTFKLGPHTEEELEKCVVVQITEVDFQIPLPIINSMNSIRQFLENLDD